MLNQSKTQEFISSYLENMKVINYIPLNKINNTNETHTIIGIGGTNLYYGEVKNLKINRENILPLPKSENFFKNIIDEGINLKYIKENTKKINCIFSYPFKSIEKKSFFDGLYVKPKYMGKKIPFREQNFILGDLLNKYTTQNISFNILNDSVSTNLYNIYKNKGYDLYISIISGTGVNFSYTKDQKVINSELGKVKIVKNSITKKIVPIESITSYQNIRILSQKYNTDEKLLNRESAKIIVSVILGIINNQDANKISIIAQGSFITKDTQYFNMINKLLKENLNKDFIFYKNNKADIKGASLL